MAGELLLAFRDPDPNGGTIEQKKHFATRVTGELTAEELRFMRIQLDELIDIREGIDSGDIKQCIADPTGIGQLEAYRVKKQKIDN